MTISFLIQTAMALVINYVISLMLKAFLKSFADAAWILAALQLMYTLYTGDFSVMSWDTVSTVLMQAMKAALAIKNTQIEKEMQKLQEEYEDFQEKARLANAEMEKLMEESGTMLAEDGSALIAWMAQLAKIENADDSMDRTLNLDNALLVDLDSQLSLDNMLRVK